VIQLPPNATGSVLASNTFAGKEYQQVILTDKDNPSLGASVDSNGLLSVSDLTKRATYTSCSGDRSPGVLITSCIANLSNIGAKKLSLLKLRVEFTEATAAAAYILSLVKTSTLAAGGVSSLEGFLKHDPDSSDPLSEARFFTTTPVQGVDVGVLSNAYIYGPITAIGSIVQALEFNWAKDSPSLKAATESFEIRIEKYDGSALATPAHAGLWHVNWTWTEE